MFTIYLKELNLSINTDLNPAKSNFPLDHLLSSLQTCSESDSILFLILILRHLSSSTKILSSSLPTPQNFKLLNPEVKSSILSLYDDMLSSYLFKPQPVSILSNFFNLLSQFESNFFSMSKDLIYIHLNTHLIDLTSDLQSNDFQTKLENLSEIFRIIFIVDQNLNQKVSFYLDLAWDLVQDILNYDRKLNRDMAECMRIIQEILKKWNGEEVNKLLNGIGFILRKYEEEVISQVNPNITPDEFLEIESYEKIIHHKTKPGIDTYILESNKSVEKRYILDKSHPKFQTHLNRLNTEWKIIQVRSHMFSSSSSLLYHSPQLTETTTTLIKSFKMSQNLKNLSQHLQSLNSSNQILSIATTRQLFSNLIQSYSDLRQLGIVHRDIKPSNILVGESLFDLHIIDFDVSLFAQDMPARFKPDYVGTKGFQAPEIRLRRIEGIGLGVEEILNVYEKADVYSLGLVFLFVLGVFREDLQGVEIDEEFLFQGRGGEDCKDLVFVLKKMLAQDGVDRLRFRELLSKFNVKETETYTIIDQDEKPDIAIFLPSMIYPIGNIKVVIFKNNQNIIKKFDFHDEENKKNAKWIIQRENEIFTELTNYKNNSKANNFVCNIQINQENFEIFINKKFIFGFDFILHAKKLRFENLDNIIMKILENSRDISRSSFANLLYIHPYCLVYNEEDLSDLSLFDLISVGRLSYDCDVFGGEIGKFWLIEKFIAPEIKDSNRTSSCFNEKTLVYSIGKIIEYMIKIYLNLPLEKQLKQIDRECEKYEIIIKKLTKENPLKRYSFEKVIHHLI